MTLSVFILFFISPFLKCDNQPFNQVIGVIGADGKTKQGICKSICTKIDRPFTGSAGTGLNNRPFDSFTDPETEAPTPIPEPGTLAVFSCGLLFFSALMRMRKYL